MEVRQTGLAGRIERLAVHERNHQNFIRRHVLRDRRQQARTVESRQERGALFPCGNIV